MLIIKNAIVVDRDGLIMTEGYVFQCLFDSIVFWKIHVSSSALKHKPFGCFLLCFQLSRFWTRPRPNRNLTER